jgi:SPX domain protein involved in polyphosphate accumulation
MKVGLQKLLLSLAPCHVPRHGFLISNPFSFSCMQFGKYLEEKQRAEWKDYYVDYKCLKDLIKEAARQQEEAGVAGGYSPRTTSLTVQRAMDSRDSAEEQFFRRLEAEVEKVGDFTATIVEGLRERLFQLQAQAKSTLLPEEKDRLLEEAQSIGDSFLHLEKFVNLNYMAAHKILKKHDKNMPNSPCRQFYISHLHNQPWVQGNYSDLLMSLSNVYSELRGDLPANTEELEDQYRYSTTKYWVRMSDISAVKHHILQHLPVYQYSDVSLDFRT